MQKLIPYVVIAVIALSAAACLLLPRHANDEAPTTATSPSSAPAPASTGSSGTSVGGSRAPSGATPPATADADGAPKEPRPPNKAEQMLAEREARPFNVHVNYVSSWWGMATRALKGQDELQQECSDLSRWLMDMSQLNSDQMNPDEVLAKELALIQKLREVESSTPNLKPVLDYLEESANVAKAGGDPAAVVKPDVKVQK